MGASLLLLVSLFSADGYLRDNEISKVVTYQPSILLWTIVRLVNVSLLENGSVAYVHRSSPLFQISLAHCHGSNDGDASL